MIHGDQQTTTISTEGHTEQTKGEIRGLLKQYYSDTPIDKKLMKRVSRYITGWVNKDDNHVSFFGSVLVGVYPIKWTKDDRAEWFDEVLEIDDISLRLDINELGAIEPKFKVSSDVTNHSMFYLIHAILTSKNLPKKERMEHAVMVLNMAQFKFLSSLMGDYFKYRADINVAKDAYAGMSRKFGLRQHGSWMGMINERSKEILAEGTKHHNTFISYHEDEEIVKLINDIQGRIRQTMKNVTDRFYEVKESSTRSSVVSSTFSLEGEQVMKDRHSDYGTYIRYINDTVATRDNFIKDEILKVIGEAVHTAPPSEIVKALEYLTDNYGARRAKHVQEFINETVLFMFGLISKSGIALSDLPTLLFKLKSTLASSRGEDEELGRIRTLGTLVVQYATGVRQDSTVSSVRTAIVLYVVLRTLAINRY